MITYNLLQKHKHSPTRGKKSSYYNDVIFSEMEGRSGSPTTHQTAEMLRSASTRLIRLAVHACCYCGQWIFAVKVVPAWCSAAKSGCVAGNSHHGCIFLHTTTNLKKKYQLGSKMSLFQLKVLYCGLNLEKSSNRMRER